MTSQRWSRGGKHARPDVSEHETLRGLLQIQDFSPPPNTCTVNQNITTFISDPQEFRNRKGVGFLHLNIISLLSRHKLDHINILVNQANPDISETWLHKDIDNQTVYIQGYNIYRSDRASRGGGVAVYVKSTYRYAAAILNAVSIPKCFEFISLKIDLGCKNSIIVIGVYRPPTAPTMALNKMAELLRPWRSKTFSLVTSACVLLCWLLNWTFCFLLFCVFAFFGSFACSIFEIINRQVFVCTLVCDWVLTVRKPNKNFLFLFLTQN